MPDPSDGADLPDPDDGFDLADVVNDRADLRDVRELLKESAAAQRDQGADTNVTDMVALAPKNDAAYIRPSDIEKAEWFADLYEQEGRPEIHPRGFHYLILGKGYETRKGEEYQNTTACWTELKEGAYWAQLLGLVDADRITDSRTESPTHYGLSSRDRAGDRDEMPVRELAREAGHLVDPDDGISTSRFQATLEAATLAHDSADEYVESEVDAIVDAFFDRVAYRQQIRQDYHIEIWAEKGDVIPEAVARDVGATVRETGGGEMTFQMCRDSLKIASEREQDLAVVVVSDFDPKGADMPKSAARKLEVESLFHSAEVEVRHAAVTIEQVKRHAIPGTPARKPSGLEHGNRGAKGYETHTELFREYAGQHPVEIRAFASRYPDAFADEIRAAVDPYHDADLDQRIDEAIAEARKQARQILYEVFADKLGPIEDARDDLRQALDRYHDEMGDDIELVEDHVAALETKDDEVRERHDVDAAIEDLRTAIRGVDIESALLEVGVDLPDPHTSTADDPLLDSRRDYLSQLLSYREFDPRTSE